MPLLQDLQDLQNMRNLTNLQICKICKISTTLRIILLFYQKMKVSRRQMLKFVFNFEFQAFLFFLFSLDSNYPIESGKRRVYFPREHGKLKIANTGHGQCPTEEYDFAAAAPLALMQSVSAFFFLSMTHFFNCLKGWNLPWILTTFWDFFSWPSSNFFNRIRAAVYRGGLMGL